MSTKNTAYFFIIAIAVVIVLVYGQGLIIPFIFSVILWFVIREVTVVLNKVSFIQRVFPSWLKNLLSSAVILSLLFLVSKIISNSINKLAKSYEKYETNVDALIHKTNDIFDVDIMEILKGHSGDIDFGTLLTTVFNSITDILGSTFMIIIYALFLFLEEAYFRPKLKKVFSEKEEYDKISGIVESIERSVAKYLGLKTLVSFITGALSYIVLTIIGIDSPVFWAFLIFLFNYIPTIGSLVGTVFPATFCLLQFGEFMPGLIVLLFVGVIQVLVGNVLEPKLMGNSMNISPLVTIVSLSFWGAVWGPVGMILSVPITVIAIIIFSQFPNTKPIAVLLSEKGRV